MSASLASGTFACQLRSLLERLPVSLADALLSLALLASLPASRPRRGERERERERDEEEEEEDLGLGRLDDVRRDDVSESELESLSEEEGEEEEEEEE